MVAKIARTENTIEVTYERRAFRDLPPPSGKTAKIMAGIENIQQPQQHDIVANTNAGIRR